MSQPTSTVNPILEQETFPLNFCIKKHSLYEDFLKVLYIYFIISLVCTSFIAFESRNYYILHWLKKN